MAYELIPARQHRTSTWSGGTTTELAIYPPQASYAARDFKWRLSTAVVSAAESTFTSLPGYRRLLMVLDGEMRIEHAGEHQLTLRPFEQDSFRGSWLTKCIGTGRDFNLMLAAGWQGSLQAIRMTDNGVLIFEHPGKEATEGFYCLLGEVRFVLSDGSEVTLRLGDLLLVQQSQEVGIAASGAGDFVHVRVWNSKCSTDQ